VGTEGPDRGNETVMKKVKNPLARKKSNFGKLAGGERPSPLIFDQAEGFTSQVDHVPQRFLYLVEGIVQEEKCPGERWTVRLGR